MKPTYSELLKDPRWQRRRLEIFNRDNFTCQKCKSTVKNLQVHHFFYEYGRLPWEYEDDALITLCFECHEKEEFLKKFQNDGFKYLLSLGFLHEDIAEIVSVISHRFDDRTGPEFRRYIEGLKELISNHG